MYQGRKNVQHAGVGREERSERAGLDDRITVRTADQWLGALADVAEKALGEMFNVQRFHDFILFVARALLRG